MRIQVFSTITYILIFLLPSIMKVEITSFFLTVPGLWHTPVQFLK